MKKRYITSDSNPNDGFVISVPEFTNGQKATDTVYSDRLWQWDPKKHDALCQKHFGNSGQYWHARKPETIQAFLRDYLNEPTLVLCLIEEHTNQSNGYPVWRFDYLIEKK